MRRFLDGREDLRVAGQRLGGDASPVEAGAAEVFLLDQRRFQALLCGIYSGDVPARASAHHNNIKIRHMRI